MPPVHSKMIRPEQSPLARLRVQGDSAELDFGEHLTGYLQFHIAAQYPADSPVRLKLLFAERREELSYRGEEKTKLMSYSWMQEETIVIDEMPAVIKLPRRYAFRYLRVEIAAMSSAFEVTVSEVAATAVTTADFEPHADGIPKKWEKIYSVAVHTLRDCMQTVYEDGPKRDRRLWIGDLRLQALTAYAVYGDAALAKRCLYLFAGLTEEGGIMPACIYERPVPAAGRVFYCDYSLLYMAALWDYYAETKDEETAAELFESALSQIRLFEKELLLESGLIKEPGMMVFIDWNDGLRKRAAAQGVALYCIKAGMHLAHGLGYSEEEEALRDLSDKMEKAAEKTFYDCHLGVFTDNGQISWAANCWLILAGTVDAAKGREILRNLFACEEAVLPVTPYLYHYVLESMISCGMSEEAKQLLERYWGGMVRQGADTFWELYKEGEPELSPYGDHLLNSACHAWSCTPAWFIKRFLI